MGKPVCDLSARDEVRPAMMLRLLVDRPAI
jgi:hypothetical protein